MQNGLCTKGLVIGIILLFVGIGVVQNIKTIVKANPTNGLIAYWKFDEGSGTIAADSSGNVNTTTLENNPAWVDGKSGKALSFDGAGNCIFKAMNTSVMTHIPLTLSAWVKPNLRTDGTDFPSNVISNDLPGHSGYGFGVNVWSDGSQMKLECPGGGWRIIPGVNFSAGIWNYVAVVYTKGNVKSYVNGQLVDDFSYSQTVDVSSHNYVWIGLHNQDYSTYGTRRYFSGTIDEVRIYNITLTQQEIQTDMGSGGGENEPPLAGTTWTQQAKLLVSDPASDSSFGDSVSISGDTALIGEPYDDNNGSAYVFTRTGTTWTQQAKLRASDGAYGYKFGYNSVSIDADTALIGASGFEGTPVNPRVSYVFTRTGTTWTQQAKLLASDGTPYDWFGYSVSLDGNTALIGAYEDDDNGAMSGSAYIFTCNGTTWTQQAKLLASDGAASDNFGYSVSLNNDTALIGTRADNDNGHFSGSVYVFIRTGNTWAQQQKLLASDGAAGDNFGYSVSLSGDTILVGAFGDDDNGNGSGSVYVFTRTGTIWTQQAKLLASDGTASDNFGNSISLSGDTALIGAYGNDSYKGSVYVFTRTGTTWTQQYKLLASDGVEEDRFGDSISLSGSTALIGAHGSDLDTGAGYVFTKSGKNEPPLAGFTWTPSTPNANQTITFDASASNDPDGSITKYEWDWNNDGVYEESHATSTAAHSWSQAGNYTVTVRITDNNSSTSTKTITVPVITGGGTNNKGTPGFELVFIIGAIAVAMFLRRKKLV